MTPGKSWGHTLRLLSDDERSGLGDWQLHCSWPKCDDPTTHEGTYRYVTGRAGRVSWARKYLCDDHSAKFATKHDITPTTGPRPMHALERIVEGGIEP